MDFRKGRYPGKKKEGPQKIEEKKKKKKKKKHFQKNLLNLSNLFLFNYSGKLNYYVY